MRRNVRRRIGGRFASPGARYPIKIRKVMRMVKKRVASRTRTATKVHQRARPLPNRSGSESNYFVGGKPKGLINKISNKLQDCSFTRNEPSIIPGTAGSQINTLVGALFNVSDLASMMSTVYTQLPSGVSHSTVKMFLKSVYCEVMIQNSTNATCRVQIWNTRPKRDVYKDQAGVTLTPLEAWSQGLKMQTSGGTGTEMNIVGSRPTDSKLFNDYYKVGKVTYIDLAPGQVHYHRMRYKIDRSIANEMLNNSGLYSLKGMQLDTMIVQYGEPMVDNTGVQTTTSNTNLHVIATKTYHFSWMQNNTSISTNTNNLSAVSGTVLENLVTGAQATFAAVI